MQDSEEEGVEPPLPLLVNLLSRQTHSATLPLFHRLEAHYSARSARAMQWEFSGVLCLKYLE
jgi:hypothetical protein